MNRKDLIINALIDIVLDWNYIPDDIVSGHVSAICQMLNKGIQPNELIDYFDKSVIAEALARIL